MSNRNINDGEEMDLNQHAKQMFDAKKRRSKQVCLKKTSIKLLFVCSTQIQVVE
jgi:hypothetical protein